ncbi:fumarylacetoacetate hydrolase family protein [Paraburkholderia sp. 35.1]|uniref:fumarylacetoacetate hydrolase family protein n=1 Tax=unclassified Paraburkholderia TaxID=2615204 RepID=UPI003D220090
MKLARYTYKGKTSVGKIEGDTIVDLSGDGIGLPADIASILASPDALATAAAAAATPGNSGCVALADVRLEAPVPAPGKFLALGMNYKDHEEEARRLGLPIPTSQVWFNKQTSCINGPYDDVHYPRVCEQLDYEAELGVVIAKEGRYISEEDALDYVGGYFVANDVSSRDWQMKSPTWTLGKSFDTHGPIGPWIVTADEIPDPQKLTLRLMVNGEVRQNSSTSLMTYSIAKQIEYLSQVMTLKPGDILVTGTPAGVGIAMSPPVFLQVGDVIRVEIDGVGHVENRIVKEPRI